MADHQLALNIDDDTKQRLEDEARWQDQSEAEIAADAIRTYLDRQAHLRRLIETAEAEADKGAFISREAMMPWVEGLFNGRKSSPPQPDVFLPPRRR